MKANALLLEASHTLKQRGKERDKPNGERSIPATVKAFNAIYGTSLTPEQGWAFMVILKLVRSSQGEFKMDDYIDLVGYGALMGEAASNQDTEN